MDLGQLADALRDFAFAYVITVGDDHRAHTVAAHPILADGVFAIDSIGNSTRRNTVAHPDVTLVWPPRAVDGYTLIVDGHGVLDGDGLRVTPGRAVLHRPAAPGPPTASACGDDCVPL